MKCQTNMTILPKTFNVIIKGDMNKLKCISNTGGLRIMFQTDSVTNLSR